MPVEMLEKLRDRLITLNEEIQSIQAAADAEGRMMSDEEVSQVEAMFTEFNDIQADIDRRERIAAASTTLTTSLGRQSDADLPGDDGGGDEQPRHTNQSPRSPTSKGARSPYNSGARVVLNAANDRGRWGWRHYGEYLNAVKDFSISRGSKNDPRLMIDASPSTYGQEGVGPDGGFAVPPEWRSGIVSKIGGDTSLLSMTDQQESSSNSITFPMDETTQWQSTGGIQAYWESEAGLITQSKPKIIPMTMRLNKLTALVPVTDELLEDAAAMAAYIQRKAPEKLDFKITDAIVNGDGVGKPLGLLNAPCFIAQAKESGQAADTIVGLNILKMYSRMPANNRRNAVWLINQDIEPQLLSLNIAFKTDAGAALAAGAPAYLPPGALSSTPYATLMGRPVIATEACGTIGDLGDIVFTDLSSYLTVKKVGGIRAEMSIHLWFDYDMAAFRFIMRLAGQPWLSAPITRHKGSNTLSIAVGLEAR